MRQAYISSDFLAQMVQVEVPRSLLFSLLYLPYGASTPQEDQIPVYQNTITGPEETLSREEEIFSKLLEKIKPIATQLLIVSLAKITIAMKENGDGLINPDQR